jgi:hypothetical protein
MPGNRTVAIATQKAVLFPVAMRINHHTRKNKSEEKTEKKH